jgi:hypothetical protein
LAQWLAPATVAADQLTRTQVAQVGEGLLKLLTLLEKVLGFGWVALHEAYY